MPKTSKLKKSWPLVLLAAVTGSSIATFEQHLKVSAEQPLSKVATIHAEDQSYSNDMNEVYTELATRQNSESELQFLTQALGGNGLDLADRTGTSESSVLFQSALELARAGQLNEAMDQYREVVRIKPNHQMAGINLAILQQRKGDWEGSLVTLEQVLKVAGGSRKGKIYALIGRAHESNGALEPAIKSFRNSIDYRPGHVATWRRLASAYAQVQLDPQSDATQKEEFSYANVRELFSKSIALDAQNASAYLNQATYQFTRLDFDGAIETLEGSQQALFSDAQAQLKDQLLFSAYLERGRFSKIKKLLVLRNKSKATTHQDLLKVFSKVSHKHYKTALSSWVKYLKQEGEFGLAVESSEIDTESALNQLLLVNLYRRAGQEAIALAKIERLQQYPDFQGLMTYQKALIETEKETTESYQTAFSLFKSLLERSVFPADVSRHLSKVAMQLDYAQESLVYAILSVKQGGEKRRFEFQRVQAERRYGSISTAVSLAAELANKYPKSRGILRLWANSLIDAGQTDLAIEKYRQLTQNNERRSDLHTLATLLTSQQKLEAAADVLESLLAKYSDDVEARYLLAENYCQNQKIAECQTQAARVLKLDRQHSGAKALIAQLSSTKNHG